MGGRAGKGTASGTDAGGAGPRRVTDRRPAPRPGCNLASASEPWARHRLLQEAALTRRQPFPRREAGHGRSVTAPPASVARHDAGLERRRLPRPVTLNSPPRARVAASPLGPDRRLAARPTHRARPPPPALFGPWQPALDSGSGVRSVPVPARPSPVPAPQRSLLVLFRLLVTAAGGLAPSW